MAERARSARRDEINIPEKGKNYGWPLATHGINYSGLKFRKPKASTLREPKTAVRLESVTCRERYGVLQQRRLPAVEKQAVYRRAKGKGRYRAERGRQ